MSFKKLPSPPKAEFVTNGAQYVFWLSVIVHLGKQAIGSVGVKNCKLFEELVTSSCNLANRFDGAPKGHL